MNDDPLRWLFGLEHLGMKFGLDNMSRLTAALGDPQRRFPSALIAGTNGKGSVTAMVDAALRAGGFRSARYTSPHLLRLEERFVIAGDEVTTPVLAAAVARVRDAVDALISQGTLAGPATFFECCTAAAFELFAAAAIDIAVLEVGLGGRLDATNIADPLVTAITTIDVDHEAQLGTTIEAIAAEKAGIARPGVPVVIGRLPLAAEQVVAGIAERLGAPIIRAAAGDVPAHARLALAGAHQAENAAVALAVLDSLAPRGFATDDGARRRGLETVVWPGRLERRRCGDADVLVDAAHNPAGARALASYVRETGWTDATLVFGAMADKDAAGMLRALVPAVTHVICTTADSPRAAAAGVLASIAASVEGCGGVDIVEPPAAALARACATSRRVVIAGSIFLIGPLRGILR